jgi:hypothetical protein
MHQPRLRQTCHDRRRPLNLVRQLLALAIDAQLNHRSTGRRMYDLEPDELNVGRIGKITSYRGLPGYPNVTTVIDDFGFVKSLEFAAQILPRAFSWTTRLKDGQQLHLRDHGLCRH